MTVHFAIEGQVGFITLDRLKAFNAISIEMIEAIYQQLQVWKNDARVHVVVIRSQTTDFFSAGGDVRSVYQMRTAPLDAKLGFFEKEYQMIYLLNTYPKPVMSLMNGITMGGGVGLGMHVAFPIAGEEMVFAMPETIIGLFPDVAGTAILNKMPRAWQNYLGVFAQRLSFDHILEFGLVYGGIQTSDWSGLLKTLIDTNWGQDAFAQMSHLLQPYLIPRSMHKAQTPKDFWRFDCESFYVLMENIESAKDDGLHDIATAIGRLCPLSMIVTFEQMKLAQGFNVKQALEQDFVLLQHFLELPEIYEGVRAMLIDKDKHPRWTYPDWRNVPYSVVQKIFYDPSIVRLCLTA